MSSWIAAATSYSTNNRIMIPFYIYYSMFGFQRIGDLAWAAGDMQARGFLLGGTAGRTTLNGEGLQHQDGHSHILSATIPNCVSYDPTFAHELAVIIQDGLRRMVENQENVFYYLTVMNENYPHPGLKPGQEEGIIKGMYLLAAARRPAGRPRVQLMGSGTILREVIAAAEMLEREWGVAADVWSCPSFTELAREGADVARQNLLNPTAEGEGAVRDAAAREDVGPDRRVDRLHEAVRRADPRLRAEGPHVSRARHRRLRPLGHAREAALALRGRSSLRRAGGAEGAGDDGMVPAAKVAEAIAKYGIDASEAEPRDGLMCARGAGQHEQERRDDGADNMIELKVPDIGDFKDVEVIEVLVKAGDGSRRSSRSSRSRATRRRWRSPRRAAGRSPS